MKTKFVQRPVTVWDAHTKNTLPGSNTLGQTSKSHGATRDDTAYFYCELPQRALYLVLIRGECYWATESVENVRHIQCTWQVIICKSITSYFFSSLDTFSLLYLVTGKVYPNFLIVRMRGSLICPVFRLHLMILRDSNRRIHKIIRPTRNQPRLEWR